MEQLNYVLIDCFGDNPKENYIIYVQSQSWAKSVVSSVAKTINRTGVFSLGFPTLTLGKDPQIVDLNTLATCEGQRPTRDDPDRAYNCSTASRFDGLECAGVDKVKQR